MKRIKKMGNRGSKGKTRGVDTMTAGGHKQFMRIGFDIDSDDDDSVDSTCLFDHKDSTCCNVAILSGRHFNKMKDILMAIQKDFGDTKKSAIALKNFGHEETGSLTIPGYRIAMMKPRMMFSRMRNLSFERWRAATLQSADAFIFSVCVEGSAENYLNCPTDGHTSGWEQNRYEFGQYIRSSQLVENPKKPLLLLVHTNDDGVDLKRLTNLLGLNRLGIRPFNAVLHSMDEKHGVDAGVLKEALSWLAKTAASKDEDETTAAETNSFPGEEESVCTSMTNASSLALGSNNFGHYMLDYEPSLLGGNPTLQRFEPVKKGTHCPFARAAKLWGGKLPDELTPRLASRVDEIQEAATLNAGPLAEFAARSSNDEALDGFCMEIPGASWQDVEGLGEQVRKLLTALADLDPSPGENAMKSMGPIDSPQWRFRFAGEDFFLTTFSPRYGKDSSRHSFGVRKGFLLFQPLVSFGRHGLLMDTPASATNWSNPTSMRDKARVAFKQNGCPYHIPEKLPYPVAEHIVKPEKDDGTSVVRWWEPRNQA